MVVIKTSFYNEMEHDRQALGCPVRTARRGVISVKERILFCKIFSSSKACYFQNVQNIFQIIIMQAYIILNISELA